MDIRKIPKSKDIVMCHKWAWRINVRKILKHAINRHEK